MIYLKQQNATYQLLPKHASFVYDSSPTKAGGVGAYIYTALNFKINNDFHLHVQGCEDLCLDIEFSNHKTYTFSVVYRIPQNKLPAIF